MRRPPPCRMHLTLAGSRLANRTATAAARTFAAVVRACPHTRPGISAGFAGASDAVLVPPPPHPAAEAQHSSNAAIVDRPTAYASPSPLVALAPLAPLFRGCSLPPGISSPAF